MGEDASAMEQGISAACYAVANQPRKPCVQLMRFMIDDNDWDRPGWLAYVMGAYFERH